MPASKEVGSVKKLPKNMPYSKAMRMPLKAGGVNFSAMTAINPTPMANTIPFNMLQKWAKNVNSTVLWVTNQVYLNNSSADIKSNKHPKNRRNF